MQKDDKKGFYFDKEGNLFYAGPADYREDFPLYYPYGGDIPSMNGRTPDEKR